MQLFSSVAGILLLSFAAEKCRELGGDDHPWRNRGERFTFTDCFDMGVGTAACLLKELIKLYLYYVRAIYVQRVRSEAAHKALTANLSQGQGFDDAVAAAREEGEAAARRAKRHVRHVMGPVLSAAWDLFETLYVGGTAAEGIVRSVGTLGGAYGGGIAGEGRMGWVGFVGGSQVGGWAGGRIGLMVYDVWNGVRLLLHRMHLFKH
ncbi:uncharacterized protein LOC130993867 [Salvia miltiorrhiza]|uniref:uncharacterized protein LOC130993867 n=1 Tax=Salvia miltiorrhiza TaxID=226208 RepID=UPI0025ABCBE3|nr:uncharacterized protein LOC130993867 [Salvia miltiorrhiza]